MPMQESSGNPHGRACGAEEAVLRDHADDGKHGQAAVVELRIQG
eukprot:CAMPEP_0204244772 /NCGR_PEP_ID=MMETSP0361-20130328/97222_1 /ASSEMBLY_ACC=CAM_ASM_000343 /TAXON_ID=268821 /ORGANISM="Scrippsiella Hangoei, Strain SHTV-5" /LENGTH=43 /DNA_ID= /DNA_START= /DNA_END= /DNA_ORIENTATION=